MVTRRCCKCRKDKPEAEFAPSFWARKGSQGVWCRKCHSAYNREKRLRPGEAERQLDRQNALRASKRAWLDEFKARVGCKRCGETHPGCLEFHHLNPDLKEATLSFLAGNNASQRILEAEVAKCEVVCANCHRIEHWEQRRDPEAPNQKYYRTGRKLGTGYGERAKKDANSRSNRGGKEK